MARKEFYGNILLMLNKFRNRHAKRILWILAIVIIAAFGLSGAGFYLAGRDNNLLGKIGDQEITTAQLQEAIKMAQLQVLLSGDNKQSLSPLDFERIGLDLLVLLWKAKQEKIETSNSEVKDYILNNIFSDRKLDRQSYDNFLKAISRRYNLNLTARTFEEQIRLFITINKLFEKYTAVEVKPQEIRELYARDTQKVKIAYLAIAYERFKVELGIAPSDIEDFYEKNKSLFEQEAKVNMAYLLIENDNPKTSQILESLPEAETLKDLAENFSLEIKETGLIGLSDPIEEIGWQGQITKIAFELEENSLSAPLETEKGILIIQKLASQPSSIPALADIEKEVKEKLILETAKGETESFTRELLAKIQNQNITNLKKLATQEKIEYKEPEEFKFYDYIEGLGLDPEISAAVFSLQKDAVSPQIFPRDTAIYIVQLKEISEVDEADFEEKKTGYQDSITRNKQLFKRMQFLQRVKQEADLDLNLLSE